MIAGLRRRHRIWIGLLALVVPAGFLLGVLGREEPRVLDALPATLLGLDGGTARTIWEHEDLFGTVPVTVSLLSTPGTTGRLLELSPRSDPRRPDVLVYWAPASAPADQLAEGAYLLGRLAGTRAQHFALPPEASAESGRLYLYSLGHQELLDSALLQGGGPVR